MKSIGKIVLLLAVVKLIFSMAVATAFATSYVKKNENKNTGIVIENK